jgi:hypothetical protein
VLRARKGYDRTIDTSPQPGGRQAKLLQQEKTSEKSPNMLASM